MTTLARTCKGTRRDGQPCRSKVVGDNGYCMLHGDSPRLDAAELGRKGGIASGEARREMSTSARERLRRLADEDEEFWGLLKDAYRDGLEAVNADGSPDYRTRVAAAGAFLSEAYGRPPQQLIGDADRPVSFVVRSAFDRGDVELPGGDR